MKKLLKLLKLVAVVLCCSLIIAHWPGLIYGTAKAIVWTAQTLTSGVDHALALAK